MAAQRIPVDVQSILAADFGSVNTRLALIDLVNGQYRLVARNQTPTTIEAPLNDVTIGLSRAVETLQNQTGRRLLDRDGLLIFPEQDDGSGVDEITATTSAARPLRAVLVGLVRDFSIASARRALNGTYIQIAEVVSVSDEAAEEVQINAILQAQPDLIFITGGTDGGNNETTRRLIDMVGVALRLFPDEKVPIVLYAGNAALGPYAYEQLKAAGVHSDVFVAGNVRPDVAEEALNSARLELSMVYSNFVSSQPGGFRDVSTVSKMGVVPTAQSVGNMLRWMSELPLDSAGILYVDVGSATSSLIVATDQAVSARVQSDTGIGHSLPQTVARLNWEAVRRWLPFPMTRSALLDYAHNKALMPSTVPHSTRDLMIEYAVAREIIRYLVREEQNTWAHLRRGQAFIPPFEPVIVSGAVLTEAPLPGITAMLVLDALEPENIVRVYLDPFSVLPALGTIALLEPIVTVQVFESQALTDLGPMFCATNQPRRRGRGPAMRIKITLSSGRVLEKQLQPGELWAAPISPGQEATVEVRLGRGLRLAGRRRLKRVVKAGAAGILFDARGRPLPSLEPAERAASLARWWSGVSGQTPADLRKWAEAAWEPVAEDDPQPELDKLLAFLNEHYTPSSETVSDEEAEAERRRRELHERISS